MSDGNKRVVDEFFEVLDFETFHNFHLLIHLICVDCHQEETFHFLLGDLFNREGNLIFLNVNIINFSHQICSCRKNLVFIDFKKFYPPAVIRSIYNGLCTIVKKRTNVW